MTPYSRTRSTIDNADLQNYEFKTGLSQPPSITGETPGPVVYGTWGPNFSGQVSENVRTRSMTDVVTPKFKELSGKGRIINNPMTQTSTKEVIDLCSYDLEYDVDKYGGPQLGWFYCYKLKSYGTFPCEYYAGDHIESSLNVDSLKDQVITKAYANISNAEMLSLSSIAELSSTVKGMREILAKVYKVYKGVRKGNLRLLKKELSFNELQEIYMNARYNLRPTYYDMRALYKVATHNIKPLRQTFRASKVDDDSDTEYVRDVLMHPHEPYVGVRGTFIKSARTDVEVRAGVLVQSNRVTTPQLLGLDRIPETLWDLTPFSFIIDWFINAGDLVAAWSPNFGMDPLASWVTVKTTKTQCISAVDFVSSYSSTSTYSVDGIDLQTKLGSSMIISTIKERIPNYQLPVIPRFDMNLDSLKLLDLGIIVNKLRQKRKLERYLL